MEYSGILSHGAEGLEFCGLVFIKLASCLFPVRPRQIERPKWDDDGTILMRRERKFAPHLQIFVFMFFP
jgi:hypothetical protein